MVVPLMFTAVTAQETDQSSFSAAGFLLIFLFCVFLHGFVLTFESSVSKSFLLTLPFQMVSFG